MDIGTPPGEATAAAAAAVQQLSEFGLRYPLPFRILLCSAITALGFATNTHLLAALGIDTALVLDVRLDHHAPVPSTAGIALTTATTTTTSSSAVPAVAAPFVHPTKIYPPVYSLGAAALAWTAAGWLAFRSLAGNDAEAAIQWRILPAAFLLGAGAALCWPGNVLCRTERFRFLRCVLLSL